MGEKAKIRSFNDEGLLFENPKVAFGSRIANESRQQLTVGKSYGNVKCIARLEHESPFPMRTLPLMRPALRFFAILAFALAICGCSAMAYQGEAMRYMEQTKNVLIEEGLCSSATDCSNKEMAFWTAGGWQIGQFSGGGVSISVYNVSSAETANKIVSRCKALHSQIPDVPAKITVYSTAHHETFSKMIAQERLS